MNRDYDVIIVGGGGSGLAAANIAADAGCRTLIVEAGDRLGGSTSLSHGVFYAAGTKVQAAAGIEDSAESMYTYMMAINNYKIEAAMARRYCEEGAKALHWLMDLGVEFPPDQVYQTGLYAEMSGVARCHLPNGYGVSITNAMEAALQKHTVDVALRTRVRQLHVKNGAVQGIETDDGVVTAGAVIIATGGFGASRELINRYYPSAGKHGTDTWYIGSAHCRGDGLKLGAEAGAGIGGFDTGLINVSPGMQKILELPPSWLIMVNAEGRRFMMETVGYGVMSGVVDAQPGGVAYGIFDHASFVNPPRDPRFAKLIEDGMTGTQWTPDNLKEALTAGRIVKGETLEELSDKLGFPEGSLRGTVEYYNADAAEPVDSLFFKPSHMMRPLGEGPYYGITMRSSILCLTSTGLRVDADGFVMSTANRRIPGLLACGETAYGAMGKSYIGSGSAVAHAIVFGRVAGQSAAASIRSNVAA